MDRSDGSARRGPSRSMSRRRPRPLQFSTGSLEHGAVQHAIGRAATICGRADEEVERRQRRRRRRGHPLAKSRKPSRELSNAEMVIRAPATTRSVVSAGFASAETPAALVLTVVHDVEEGRTCSRGWDRTLRCRSRRDASAAFGSARRPPASRPRGSRQHDAGGGRVPGRREPEQDAAGRSMISRTCSVRRAAPQGDHPPSRIGRARKRCRTTSWSIATATLVFRFRQPAGRRARSTRPARGDGPPAPPAARSKPTGLARTSSSIPDGNL